MTLLRLKSRVVTLYDAHAHIFPEVRGPNTRGIGYGRVAMGDQIIQMMPPLCERTVYTAEMLIANMDWAGIERTLLLQGPFYGECNAYALEAVQRYPKRLAAAAYLDPWTAGWQEQFERLFAQPGFCAVKLEFTDNYGLSKLHPGARLDEPHMAWLWEQLEARGIVLTLDLGSVGMGCYQTDAVRDIAQHHPKLKIVICHLAQPKPEVQADTARWEKYLEQLDLGKLPNVWFDTSALPAYMTGEDVPYPSAGYHIRHAAERIGAAKLLWGTDQPGLFAVASLPQLARMAQLHTAFLAADEQALVLAGNAAHVYGL